MRILVTGSRNWTNDVLIEDVLWEILDRNTIEDSVLVSGACPEGADMMAEDIAVLWGLPVERHPAKWHQYGMAAGQIRNQEMVDLGADICIAFIACCIRPHCPRSNPHGSHGATKCSEFAKEAGIKTEIYRSY